MKLITKFRINYSFTLEIIWLLVIFLVPLFFLPLSHQMYSLNKALLLQSTACIMFGLWLAHWLSSQPSPLSRGWKTLLKKPLHLAIMVFGLLNVISTGLSITPEVSFWGSWARHQGLLTIISWVVFFLIIAQYARTREQLLRIIYTLLLSSGLVAVLGVLQYYLPDAMVHFFRADFGNGRIFSTTGHVNSLSIFLAMTIPITLTMMFYHWDRIGGHKSRNLFIALGFVLILQFWCLVLAQYSITLLNFIVAPIVFLVLLGFIRKKKLLLWSGLASMLILGITAILLVMPGVFSEKDDGGIGGTSNAGVAILEELGINTITSRIEFWRAATNVISDSPEVPFSDDSISGIRSFVGYGQETFIVTSQLYFPDYLKSSWTERSLFLDRPHNHYLYLGVSVGLLGLLGFLAILAAFFYLSWKNLRKTKSYLYQLVLIAIMAGMVQYMVDSLFNPSTLPAELIFWLYLAIVPVIVHLTEHDSLIGEEQKHEEDAREVASTTSKTRGILSIACVIFFITMGVGVVSKPLLADIKYQEALVLQAQNSPATIYKLNEVVESDPNRAAYWGRQAAYVYGISFFTPDEATQIDMLNFSISYFEKARELEPYLAFWHYTEAEPYLYLAYMGDESKWADVERLYSAALELFPENAVILDKWAFAMIVKADYGQAQGLLSLAASIDSNWPITNYLTAVTLVLEGNSTEAALEIIKEAEVNVQGNLSRFVDLSLDLALYELLDPVETVLRAYIDDSPDLWTPYALLGIVDFFAGDIELSLDRLDKVSPLVPEKYSESFYRAILTLAEMNAGFGWELIEEAEKWQLRFSKSQGSEKLLERFNQLIDRLIT